jgi:hypothetical protein
MPASFATPRAGAVDAKFRIVVLLEIAQIFHD